MSARRFAADTEVPVARSRAAIEALLQQHGASHFAYGWDPKGDRIQFTLKDRTIRFLLPRPNAKDPSITHTASGLLRTVRNQQAVIEQLDRQRWRALYLVVRAKLEAVEAGIAMFEQEFLAFIVMPDGEQTIGDILVPRLNSARELNRLLPAENPR